VAVSEGSALGRHGVRWSGSAGATVAVGLLSVSIPTAFSNVGFVLLRLKQHTPLPLWYNTQNPPAARQGVVVMFSLA
jgi:hypothetical protein